MDNQNLNHNKNTNNNKQKKKKPGFSFIFMVTLFTALLVAFLSQTGGVNAENEISYDEFLAMVEEGKVESVEIQDEQIVITEKKENEKSPDKLYYTGVVEDDTLPQTLNDAGVKYSKMIPDNTAAIVMSL